MSQLKRRKDIRGAIIGMVMGDASLYRNYLRNGDASGNHKISIAHSVKQREYLEHKAGVIQPLFDYPLPISESSATAKRGGKRYPVVRLQTRVHPRLSQIANNICEYGDRGQVKQKRINDYVLNNITLEGLAYWWMDDGHLQIDKRPGHGGGWGVWGLYGFPKEDVEKLRDWIEENFDCSLNVCQHVKGGYFLRRGISELRKLLDQLKPYATPDMAYKFEYPEPRRNGYYNLSSSR